MGLPHIKARCGAKTRAGKPCENPAMENGRCRMHSGNAPSGIASPNFKHGRYSKHLPERMAAEYQGGRKDAELLAMREDIALLLARQCDVLQRVDTGESGELWRSLLACIKEVQASRRAFDSAMHLQDFSLLRQAGKDLNEVLDAMEGLCQEGVSDWAAWSEVKSLAEHLRKLRESEMKRLVAMQQMVTEDAATAMLGKVLLIIRTHVLDPDALRGISADIRRVVALSASG